MKAGWRRRGLALCLVAVSLPVLGAAPPAVVIGNGLAGDLALELAAAELRAALARTEAAGKRILLDVRGPLENRAVEHQAYVIEPDSRGLRITSSGAGGIYGAYRLAEMIRSDGVSWDLRVSAEPAFAERMFSYEGTVFSLPDEGYYFRDPPYVNHIVLNEQIEAAKEAMRKLARYGFNSVAFLHLNIEDYVNYDLLGDGTRVYSPDSLHRRRSEVFIKALSDLAAYAHRLHMQLFIQVYEFSLPDHLDGRRIGDDSAASWEMIDAKYTELLRKAPIDGIVVTATEPSPRLNYRGFILWKTQAGAGRMAARMQQVIVNKNHRRMIFRLWRVANDAAQFEQVLSTATDPDILFDAKHTDGDFFLNVGENRVLREGGSTGRPFMATFDSFREFDGWGRTIFYPRFWGERFRGLKRNGVVAVNAWGPWVPGCIYPGVWVGKYDEYDFVRHGHSPSLATLYLFSRLAWDPDLDPDVVAEDWVKLEFGPESKPIREALALSEELWRTTYIDSHPYSQIAFKWTMLFLARPEIIERMGPGWSVSTIRDLNARGVALAKKMWQLVYSVTPGKQFDPALEEMRRAAGLTLLFFETFTRWRELLYLRYRSPSGMAAEDRSAAHRLVAELEGILPEWRQYPREAKDWLIFRFDPDLITAPAWMTRTSVAETVAGLKKELADQSTGGGHKP